MSETPNLDALRAEIGDKSESQLTERQRVLSKLLWLVDHEGDGIQLVTEFLLDKLEQLIRINAENRAAGREEALQILLGENPELFCDEPINGRSFVGSHPIGDTGDYGTNWNEPELRDLFGVPGKGATHSLIENLQGVYWDQLARIDELQRAVANGIPIEPTEEMIFTFTEMVKRGKEATWFEAAKVGLRAVLAIANRDRTAVDDELGSAWRALAAAQAPGTDHIANSIEALATDRDTESLRAELAESALDVMRLAMVELIACKDLAERMEGVFFGTIPQAEHDAIEVEYKRRMPIAWEAARAAIKFCPCATHPDTARLNQLEALIKACPHAHVTYNEDPDLEDDLGMVPVGFSIRIRSCKDLDAVAPSLREVINIADKAPAEEE